MNVLFERGFAPQCFEVGLSNVFRSLGHEFVSYNPNMTPTFDAFESVSPHLYIGSVTQQPRAVKKCLKEFRTKFHAIEAIPPGADVIGTKAGKMCDHFRSEVAYVGGYDKSLEDYIGRVALYFNLKVYQDVREQGPRWGMKNELGLVSEAEISEIYATAECSLAFDDPHKFYQIIMAGGFPLARKFHLPHLPYSFSFTEAENLCDEINYITDEKNKKVVRTAKNAIREQVLRNHTYFHRVFDVLNNVKSSKAATNVLNFYYEKVFNVN